MSPNTGHVHSHPSRAGSPPTLRSSNRTERTDVRLDTCSAHSLVLQSRGASDDPLLSVRIHRLPAAWSAQPTGGSEGRALDPRGEALGSTAGSPVKIQRKDAMFSSL